MPFEKGEIQVLQGRVKKATIDKAYARYLEKAPAEVITYDTFSENYREARRKQAVYQQEKRLGAGGRQKAVKRLEEKIAGAEAQKAQEKAQAQLQALKNKADRDLEKKKEAEYFARNFEVVSKAESDRRYAEFLAKPKRELPPFRPPPLPTNSAYHYHTNIKNAQEAILYASGRRKNAQGFWM